MAETPDGPTSVMLKLSLTRRLLTRIDGTRVVETVVVNGRVLVARHGASVVVTPWSNSSGLLSETGQEAFWQPSVPGIGGKAVSSAGVVSELGELGEVGEVAEVGTTISPAGTRQKVARTPVMARAETATAVQRRMRITILHEVTSRPGEMREADPRESVLYRSSGKIKVEPAVSRVAPVAEFSPAR